MRKFVPILPFIGFWVVSFFSYNFGLTVHASISGVGLGLFLFYIAAFVIAYTVPVLMPLSAKSEKKEVLPGRFMTICLLYLVLLGHLIILGDKVRSGITLAAITQNAEGLRTEYGTTIWTTVGAALAGFLYPALICAMVTVRRLDKKKRVVWGGLYAVIGSFLLIAIVNGNRAAFLQVMLWSLLFATFAAPNTPALNYLKSNQKRYCLFGGGFLICTICYFIWVSTYRISESFLQRSAEGMDLRYRLPEMVGGARMENGILMLSVYIDQPIGNFDVLQDASGWIGFDPTPLVAWHRLQLARFGIGTVEAVLSDCGSKLTAVGLEETMWPSMLGHAVIYWGKVGALVFFVLLGLIMGIAVRCYFKNQSLYSLLVVFTCYSFANFTYMAIPADHMIAYAEFWLVLFGLFKIALPKRPKDI